MKIEKNNSLSIITASYNSAGVISDLIESLRNQTDQAFTWILVDGGSNDETIAIATEAVVSFGKVLIKNENDFGIYHALNVGIKACQTDYYVVAGSDDFFYPDAVEKFKDFLAETIVDIAAANIVINREVVKPRPSSLIWLYGGGGLIASHSISTAIRTGLHNEIGFYSNLYPIYADGEFIIRAYVKKAIFGFPKFCAGEFSTDGVSNKSQIISFTDQFKALVANGKNFYLQWLLFNLRLLKWRRNLNQRSRREKGGSL
jgi:glycosyltransferase involved in cell wall biosynthesis